MTLRLSYDGSRVLSDIINTVYSDISTPGVWDEISDLIKQVIPSDSLIMHRYDPHAKSVRESASIGISPQGEEEYTRYYHRLDPITHQALARDMPVFRPCDISPGAEWKNTEFFVDYVLGYNKPQEGLLTAVKLGTELHALLVLGREGDKHEFSREDAMVMRLLQPHFTNAFCEVQYQEDLDRAKKAVYIELEESPSAVFIFDRSGCLVHANQRAKAIYDESIMCFSPVFERVRLAANELFANLQCGRSRLGLTIGNKKYHLERFMSDASHCCVRLTDREDQIHASVARLGANHRLSSREIEVCFLLVHGRRNRDIARTLGISEFTVKDHVKSIFQKLGISNKNEILTKVTDII